MRLLIIGCGGVGRVAIYKCCENPLFTEICIASRTIKKCKDLAESLKDKTKAVLTTACVDADSLDSLTGLMKEYKPHTVLNVALPYQD
ncbi:MAG TPA: saccharopine dehydrogenase, partial [Lachnospiraceae bacterium]|nr:saccharopine dehydrogenase [Lachnospiraceae bacterium]